MLDDTPLAQAQIARVRAALAQDADAGSSDFDLNGAGPEVTAHYRPAAVLVPLVPRAQGLSVILTKRASHLKHHPGQIAFPGGKVDASDADPRTAALREAAEEIALPAGAAQVLGRLPTHKTVTAFEIHPFVALIDPGFKPQAAPGEVSEVFEVPFAHVTNPTKFLIEGRRWRGARRAYYTVPFGPYYIWGATARMLRLFADRLGAEPSAD
ncbi:MAG: CoA pyrophosphatase [Pseudomonadota bacterium]